MTPDELHRRIVAIREDLDSLAHQIYEQTKDGSDDAPDTDSLLSQPFMMGAPTGIMAAFEALEGIDLDQCREALDSPAEQRLRRDEWKRNPQSPAFASIASEIAKIRGKRTP